MILLITEEEWKRLSTIWLRSSALSVPVVPMQRCLIASQYLTTLNGVATISSPDARTLVIQPWDTQLLKDIQKAIQASELGINPQNDGRVIRLIFPQLTEERRKELAKQVKKYAEEAKVAMRNIRRDGMDYVKKLKKNSEITEDDQKKAEKDLQDMLDKYTKKADEALAAKEKELLAI